jgi:hypothetical protein
MSQDTKVLIIVGGGKFGKKALDYAKYNKYTTILIDINPDCYCAKYTDFTLDNIDELAIQELTSGKSYFLNQDIEAIYNLPEMLNPEFIIPVVPVHLMANLIISLLNKNTIDISPNKELVNYLATNGDQDLILSHNSEQGVVYLSYARIDEVCPDNCAGPLIYCPNFKREKDITITQYLKDFFHSNEIVKIEKNDIINIFIIIESQQLIAGLGGLNGKDINFILKEVNNNIEIFNNQEFNITIATTCNCHGVVNFYKNSMC